MIEILLAKIVSMFKIKSLTQRIKNLITVEMHNI